MGCACSSIKWKLEENRQELVLGAGEIQKLKAQDTHTYKIKNKGYLKKKKEFAPSAMGLGDQTQASLGSWPWRLLSAEC